MGPSYSITEFEKACKQGRKMVLVTRGARETGRLDFRLNNDREILSFIGHEGLEGKHFLNTKPWAHNPDRTVCIMVDAYGFYSGDLYGYIAFLFNQRDGKWMIKSFKKNDQPDTRNKPFGKLSELLKH